MNWEKYRSKVKIFFRYFFPVKDHFKVDFVVAGVQKGGTTALDYYLRKHSEVCMGIKKEVHYFDHDHHFRKNKDNYSQYHANFNPREECKIIGEATPSYIFWKNAPERIWKYNPAMKIIVIYRDPIERAYSHWNMIRSWNKENLSFLEALKAEDLRIKSGRYKETTRFAYRNTGYYGEQLEELWKYFPKTQTLLLRNNELREQPEKCLQKVSDFLQVGAFQNIKQKSIHTREYKSTLETEELTYLRMAFKDDMEKFQQMVDWPIDDWLVMN